MYQSDFEKRKAAQIKALKVIQVMDQKPIVKVIDLVEMLLKENPSLQNEN